VEIERTLTGNILGILTTPITYMIEQRRFERAKWRAAADVIRFATDAKRAWYRAVAARQIADYVAETRDAAEAQAQLARQMTAVGNFPRLDYAREQIFYAETAARLAHARLAAAAEREKLTRMLGLWGATTRFQLPSRLPELPEVPAEGEGIEAKAIGERLDIRMARAEVDGIATSLGLTRATRFVNVLEAIYMQAVNRLADIAVEARSEVRTTYTGYRTSFDLAQHYRTQILPVRQSISDELMLRYNGMLISVFELLTNARDQIADVIAAIGAQRDFWLAETELQVAMTIGIEGSSTLVSTPITARSPAAAGGH
jgi:outer membrane protein TolC